jgi:hypothetical protein
MYTVQSSTVWRKMPGQHSFYVKEHTVECKPVMPVTRLADGGVGIFLYIFLAGYSVLATLLMPPILYF